MNPTDDDARGGAAVRVALCDDHPVVRAGVSALLSTAHDIEVVRQASSAEELLAADLTDVDVVLMDLQLSTGPMQGAAATAVLRDRPHAPAVLILTNYDTDADIVTALGAGAVGYLLKDSEPSVLLQGIRDAARGQSVLAPAASAALLNQLRSPQASLSPREIEVLTLVQRGRSNAQIARELFLSEATVKSHLVHVNEKLGAASRTQAVAIAAQRGLLRGG